MYKITYYKENYSGGYKRTDKMTAVVEADDMNKWLADNKHNKIIEMYYERKGYGSWTMSYDTEWA